MIKVNIYNKYFIDMERENTDLYKYGSNKIKELNIDLWNKINDFPLDTSARFLSNCCEGTGNH